MRVTIFALVLITAGQPASGAERLITPPASDPGTQQPTAPQPAFKDIRPSGQPIVLQPSQGTMIRLPNAATTVFIADADVADVQVQPPEILYVFGKKAGATVLYVSDIAGNIMLSRVVAVEDREITVFHGARREGAAPRPIILQIPLQAAQPTP